MDANFKSFAKKLVSSNTYDAIHFLTKSVKTDSPVYNQLLLFENNYTNHTSSFHKGLLSYEDFSTFINRLSLGLLNLIDDVKPEELSSSDSLRKTQIKEIGERSERLIVNQIIKIDDKKENLKKRKLIISILFPLSWFLSILLLLVVENEEGRNFFEYIFRENELVSLFFLGFSVLFGIMLIRTVRSYYQNDKELPRKIEQLQIEL